MSEPIQNQIAGLQNAMTELAYGGASRASGKAIRAGLKVFEKAIKAATPVGPTRKYKGNVIKGGSLRRSVGSRFVKSGRGGVMRAKAGLNVGKGRPVRKGASDRRENSAPHAPWIALGTEDRWSGSKGIYKKRRGLRSIRVGEKSTGKPRRFHGRVKPNDFVEKASKAAEPAAMQAVTSKLEQELRAEAAKAAGGAR